MSDRAAGRRSCPCGSAQQEMVDRRRQGRFYRCARCGLLRREEPPAPEVVRQGYEREYWRRYGSEQVGPARDNLYEHVLGLLARQGLGAGLLVDVGCGAGGLLDRAAREGWRTIGYDLSAQAVAAARERGHAAHQQAWPPCPLPDATADAVAFVNVLDHLSAPLAALEEARRVLRPGGGLYVRLPNAPVHVRLMGLLRPLGLAPLPVFHLYGFGRDSLRYHVDRLGFRIAVLQAAPPSKRYAYGDRRGLDRVAAVLKAMDRQVQRLARASGLDRRGWGLSLELLALKRDAG